MKTSIGRRALAGHCIAAFLGLAVISSQAVALDRSVVGRSGMVVAGHPLAVQAGLKVLQAGGTACDAAVATATVLSIAMTDMMGPADSGYALIWEPRKKEPSSIDYNGVAPAATDPKNFVDFPCARYVNTNWDAPQPAPVNKCGRCQEQAGEQVHGGNVRRVVTQESSPPLIW